MFPINSPIADNNILPEALRLLGVDDRVAILTLVAIEGSAPYPIGSQMLVRADGSFIGQITGGCAEVAIGSTGASGH